MRNYWNSLSLMMFIVMVKSQCTNDVDTLQIGSYSEFVDDRITSFCQNIDIDLPSNQTHYSHMASFEKMEQFFGVMFGMKHFEVSTKYLPSHQLAIVSVFYANYEWKIVTINYLISVDPLIYSSSFVVEQWNADQCQSGIESQGSRTFFVPDHMNTTVAVMLKGMTCYSENCGITDLDWTLQNGLVQLRYNYVLEFDFTSSPQPMKAQFVYIVFSLHDQYFIQHFSNLNHEATVKAGRAFNNFIVDEEVDRLVEISDESTNIFIGLSEIGSVLNKYSALKVQKKIYEGVDGGCFSLVECQVYGVCGNCTQDQIFLNGSCQCFPGFEKNENQTCVAKGQKKFLKEECGEGQYFNQFQCQQCEQNCSECSHNGKCTKCLSGFFQFQLEGRIRCLSFDN